MNCRSRENLSEVLHCALILHLVKLHLLYKCFKQTIVSGRQNFVGLCITFNTEKLLLFFLVVLNSFTSSPMQRDAANCTFVIIKSRVLIVAEFVAFLISRRADLTSATCKQFYTKSGSSCLSAADKGWMLKNNGEVVTATEDHARIHQRYSSKVCPSFYRN